MTKLKFQKTCGHAPQTQQEPDGDWSATCLCSCSGQDVALVAFGPTESSSLARLMHEVYRLHSKIVFEKQGWRCAECGAAGGRLEIDHIQPRSKGADHRISNLRAVCASFTGCRAHLRKHSQGEGK